MPTPRSLRRKRATRIGGAVLVAILAGVMTVRLTLTRTSAPGLERIGTPLNGEELQILKLVNAQRARAGEPLLQFSEHLAAAARKHSEDMARHHYLGRKGSAGDSPATRVLSAGVPYKEIAENVYSDKTSDLKELPEHTVQQWLNDPDHRANLLSPTFRKTAVGVVRSRDGSVYVTEDFVR